MSSKEELRENFFEKFDPEFIGLGYDLMHILTKLEDQADWAELISKDPGFNLQKAYTVVGLNLLQELRALDPEPPIPTSKRQQEINAQLMKQFFPNRS